MSTWIKLSVTLCIVLQDLCLNDHVKPYTLAALAKMPKQNQLNVWCSSRWRSDYFLSPIIRSNLCKTGIRQKSLMSIKECDQLSIDKYLGANELANWLNTRFEIRESRSFQCNPDMTFRLAKKFAVSFFCWLTRARKSLFEMASAVPCWGSFVSTRVSQ